MATGYTINYSDPGNPASIFVADGTINQQSTSLKLIGRNYPSYGQGIAENLVHLLENFSSSTPPKNSIQGQLWFDTSDPNNKRLKVNDGGGSLWSPVNGVFQQPDQPSNVRIGDIWVDTANQQLKFYNGLSFTLVGPSYSSATRTGIYPLPWNDTQTPPQTHEIIISYVDDTPISVIAKEAFTPNPVISDGFSTINPGLNISSTFPTIYGIADSAASLKLSNPSAKISADNFMRKDTSQNMLGSLRILVDGNALQIGTDSTFNIERRSGYDAAFVNTHPQGQFSFEVLNSKLLEINGPNKLVRINSPASISPTAGMEIWGSMKVSNTATVNTLYVASTASNIAAVPGNAVEIAGGAGISGTLVVHGKHILKGPLVIGEASGSPLQPGIVLPTQSDTYDIGSQTEKWNNVYANIFQSGTSTLATFVGIATSARQFVQPSAVRLTGDMTSTPINFVGNSQALNINASPTLGLIANRTTATITTGSDSILVATSTDIYQQKKRDFLRDINYQDGVDAGINPGYTTPAGALVPVGTVLPYAGSVTSPPPGWVICNGAALPADDKYQNLRNVIQQIYDPTGTRFLTPNLSGKLTSGTAPNVVQINYIMKY